MKKQFRVLFVKAGKTVSENQTLVSRKVSLNSNSINVPVRFRGQVEGYLFRQSLKNWRSSNGMQCAFNYEVDGQEYACHLFS